MKKSGWMVNFAMRRVEEVWATLSLLNRDDYGRYRGPRRTYMLHDCQVYDSEREALSRLYDRMRERHDKLVAQTRKYKTELDSVMGALVILAKEGKQ
jgi:hypothetical protein